MAARSLEFLVSSSSRERRALAASTLGWMLDGMDVTLYAMVLRELLRELQLTTAQAGLLASVTLVASAVGGILFGLLADRFGRRTALIISIVVYSVFTAACGSSHGLWELAAWRLGVGLGMGGEWATGAALVSETWPDQHRGKALGLMQSGFAIGYALAAVIAALIMPRWGWRPVFFAGILPALLALWIGTRVEESPLWLRLGKRDTGDGTRGSGFGVRGSEFGIWNLEFGIRNEGFETNR
jgi:MFS family permease